ncbi:MAG: transposase [Chitinispirillaceae bacterium]|nr:transposase [Chitinispirillaceae bacterium]
MPKNYKGRSLIGFQKDFPDDESCARHLAQLRWPYVLHTIKTDGWRSYGKASKDKDLKHCRVVLRDPKAAGRLLPWIHKLISNTKNVVRGTHRGVSGKHLQSYLSEVAYRLNRRFWEREMFDRLIQACVTAETVTYPELVHGILPEKD